MLQKITALLRDAPQLVKKHKADTTFGTIRRGLLEGIHGPVGGGNVVDDKDLLWTTSTGEHLRLSIPRALAYGTRTQNLCSPGGGKDQGSRKPTILLANPRRDVHHYVLSCRCR